MSGDAGHVVVDAVIFDMDGTLLDSERLYREVFLAAAAARGHDLAPRYDAFIGRSSAACRALLAEWHPELDYEQVAAEAHLLWKQRAPDDVVPVKDGVHAALDRLDALRLGRAVATSTPGVRARAKLAATGLLPRLAAVVGGDEVETPKPAPDIYLEAARRIGVDPRRCLAIEDSPTGFAAARAAGCFTILVPDLISPPADALHVLDSLHILAERLDALL